MKIYLFCNLGLSTSILVKNMVEDGQKRGLELDVNAYSISDLSKYVGELDAALLGSQVGYRLKEAEGICKPAGVPVGCIPMQAYGMCDGHAVVDFALELIKTKQEK